VSAGGGPICLGGNHFPSGSGRRNWSLLEVTALPSWPSGGGALRTIWLSAQAGAALDGRIQPREERAADQGKGTEDRTKATIT